jgi:hypothetical protein
VGRRAPPRIAPSALPPPVQHRHAAPSTLPADVLPRDAAPQHPHHGDRHRSAPLAPDSATTVPQRRCLLTRRSTSQSISADRQRSFAMVSRRSTPVDIFVSPPSNYITVTHATFCLLNCCLPARTSCVWQLHCHLHHRRQSSYLLTSSSQFLVFSSFSHMISTQFCH